MAQPITLRDLKALPPEVAQIMAPHVAVTSPETLETINKALAKKRDDAKNARSASGIEKVWQQCEEAYIGIDDANRTQFAEAKWAKPMSMTGPVTTNKTPKQPDYKSTVFIRLTARYVDAGAAKLCEILLPPNDKAFSFSEMPVPRLIRAKEDKSQVIPFPGGPPLTRDAQPHELAAMGAQPASPAPVSPASASGVATAAPPLPTATAAPAPNGTAPPQVPVTVKDFAEEAIELARKKAKKAEEQIFDWLVRCGYNGEARKMIFDASRIGVGVIKGPVPKMRRDVALGKQGQREIRVDIQEKLYPVVEWCDPWNIFPDPACGENIHNGDYVFERDYLSARQLRELRNQPGYIAAMIDKVLEEGPGNVRPDANRQHKDSDYKDRYEVWYYHGILTGAEYECVCAASNPPSGDTQSDKDQVYAIVTVVNDCIVKAVINPLESGQFPYHSVPWQRRAGHWAGIGVAEQVKAPQDMVNGAERAMMNNAGKSAGSIIVIDRSRIMPADGNWVMTPDKIFWSTTEGVDVREAMNAFEVPNQTQWLQSIIDHAMQLAEESTSIPLITQGESGATTPDTFGAAQLQNNNANQLLRSIGYAFDDYVTEPLVRQFYEWYLLDPDIDDEDKGEFQISAHGSVTLVERAIEDQTIATMGQVVANPIYGLDPKRWAKQWLKSRRLAPDDFAYSDEEQKRIDATPPPPAPAVQAAQVRAESAEKIAVADNATKEKGIVTDATVRLHDMQTQRDLLMLEYSLKHGITIDQLKADLAGKAMELNTQERLNAQDNAVEIHKHANPKPERPPRGMKPPVQTPGRAGNGRAFEQHP